MHSSFFDGFGMPQHELITWLEFLVRLRNCVDSCGVYAELIEECIEHRPTAARDMFLLVQELDDVYDELNVVQERRERECPF